MRLNQTTDFGCKSVGMICTVVVFFLIAGPPVFASPQFGKRMPNNLNESAQRKRELEFVRSTSTREIDQLFEALSQVDGENYNLVHARGLTPGLDPNVHMLSILSDRRVSKIFQILAEMPAASAAQKVTDVFEKKLADYKSRWEKANDQNGMVLENFRYGLSASLFLCSQFLDEKDFDRVCGQWIVWHWQTKAKPTSDFRRNAGPQCLLIINLYLFYKAKKVRDLDELNELVDDLSAAVGCGNLSSLRRRPLFTWDSDLDLGRESEIRQFPVFETWGQSRELWGTRENFHANRMRAIIAARRWVFPPNHLQSWFESKLNEIQSAIDTMLGKKSNENQ